MPYVWMVNNTERDYEKKYTGDAMTLNPAGGEDAEIVKRTREIAMLVKLVALGEVKAAVDACQRAEKAAAAIERLSVENRKLIGSLCPDEGCPHFGTAHVHDDSAQQSQGMPRLEWQDERYLYFKGECIGHIEFYQNTWRGILDFHRLACRETDSPDLARAAVEKAFRDAVGIKSDSAWRTMSEDDAAEVMDNGRNTGGKSYTSRGKGE